MHGNPITITSIIPSTPRRHASLPPLPNVENQTPHSPPPGACRQNATLSHENLTRRNYRPLFSKKYTRGKKTNPSSAKSSGKDEKTKKHRHTSKKATRVCNTSNCFTSRTRWPALRRSRAVAKRPNNRRRTHGHATNRNERRAPPFPPAETDSLQRIARETF